MILHVRCLRGLRDTLHKYLSDDKTEELIKDLLNIKGTNSSFKHVFKDLLEYINKR